MLSALRRPGDVTFEVWEIKYELKGTNDEFNNDDDDVCFFLSFISSLFNVIHIHTLTVSGQNGNLSITV